MLNRFNDNFTREGEINMTEELQQSEYTYQELCHRVDDLTSAYNAAGRYTDEAHAQQWQKDILEAVRQRDLMLEHIEVLKSYWNGHNPITIRKIV